MHGIEKAAMARGAERMAVRIGVAGSEPVTFSVGIERFIGVYPRLDGICPPGKLLKYKRAG